jgi:hypothetical protein
MVTWLFAGMVSLLLAADEGVKTAAKPAGEVAQIFDGKSLDGWVVEGTKARGGKPIWRAEDGKIVCDGFIFGFLRYEKEEFGDFRLDLEYKLGKKGNSGIGVRTVPFTGKRDTRPSLASYEIQLLDDAGEAPSEHSTGSLYRYVAPTSISVKPAGEWNKVSIECVGPHIKVTINDVVVQDVDQSAHPKIKDKPLKGCISLQNHGHHVEFRNLQVTRL